MKPHNIIYLKNRVGGSTDVIKTIYTNYHIIHTLVYTILPV